MGIRLLSVAGTRLVVPGGTLAVEAVESGTVLLDGAGAGHAVRWVGRTRLMPAELAGRPWDWPVRVAAGALGEGVPARDVVLLPWHPVRVGDFPPVAARWLVDGGGVTREAPGAALDILWLDMEGEGNPDPGALCRAEEGAGVPEAGVLAGVRRVLVERSGRVAGAVRGSVDVVAAGRVAGWAEDGSGRAVAVEVVVNGVPYPPVMASRYRADLEQAGIAGGRAGFQVVFEVPLDMGRSQLIAVRRAWDGAGLPGSPVLVEAAVPLAARVAAVGRSEVEGLVREVAARLEG